MSLDTQDLGTLAALAEQAAGAAGAYIGSVRQSEIAIEHKSVGDSLASQVVTQVDRRSQQIILEILAPSLQRFNLALLSEESPDNRQRLDRPAFWSIDPMDGTLAFVRQQPGFSVSIGLVSRSGEPLVGVVQDPLGDHLYSAIRDGACVKDGRRLTLPVLNTARPLVLQTDASFAQHPWLEPTRAGLQAIADQLDLPGAQIEFRIGAVMNACSILEDANRCYFKYPRSGNAGGSLWDYAATACLYQAIGGTACDAFGRPFDLNRGDSTFMNHAGILFSTHPPLTQQLIALHERIAGK